MINGNLILKKKYPDFDDDSRTPNGLDLRLGNVYELSEDCDEYGLYEERKFIPEHIPVPIENDYTFVEVKGWFLKPRKAYILEIDRQIKISDDCAQLYRPRSTLLRAGVSLLTATGDAGFNGKLAFLCVNHSTRPFFIEKGVRFAQLIDFEVKGVSTSYDGDYQEEERKEEKLDKYLPWLDL